MYSNVGAAQVAKNTAVTTGLLTPIPVFNWGTHVPAAGQYYVGYACYNTGGPVVIGGNTVPVNTTTNFWSAPITVNSAGSWVNGNGSAPAAPVLASPLSFSNQTLAGTFTEATAIPDITGFTVTATPTVGAAVTLSLPATATSFSLSGLVNSTQYAVTVTATNSIGSTVSSPAVNGTPAPAACPAPPNFAAPAGAEAITLTWDVPTCAISGNPAIVNYTVTYQDTTAAGPVVTVSPAVSPLPLTGLVAGHNYTVTVQANYASPYSGAAASLANIAPLSNVVVVQDVSATRPVGALVMTQVCGSWGAIPFIAANSFFPVDLQAVTASNGGSQQIDALGNATGSQSPNPTLDGGGLDLNFGAYPYPVETNPASPKYGQPIAVYPTHCGLNLGTAKLITNTGYGVQGLSGQYFQTAGQLNQVTVVNTDERDTGWTVKGSLSNFVKSGVTEAAASPTQKFSSNHFGWNPVLTAASGNTYGEYAISVGQGGAVDPLSGGAGAAGAFSQKTLGSAAAGLPATSTTAWGNQATGSLGMAKFDARVKLLIPVWAVSGVYKATLTLSAV
jgi:hypothetical protein